MTDRFTIEIVPSPVYEIELTGRGPQGMQGPKGDTGATGPAGPAGPQGPKGDRGDSALSFTVGETVELPTSNSAYVENVGTDQDVVLDFGIPRGLTGASGKGVDIGSIIQSLSKVAPDGFVHTWGESISQEENPDLYQACVDGTLPTVNASNGGVSTIYAPNGIFKQTPGTNTLEINTDVVIELAKIGGVVEWNGYYNPQPTGNITLASLSQNTETQILMFTEGGQNEVYFRFLEGSYSGKLPEAPSSPSNNTLYFNTTDKTYYIYEGGDWNQYGASGVGYIYLGGIVVTADPATATWDDATFVATDVTTTGLSEYDQQLVANKGNCGYFGLDTTELSVRVPTMQNVFLEENDTEVGSYKEAGLPNITGTGRSLYGYNGTEWTGALSATTSGVANQSIGGTDGSLIGFDASRSNPIYGNSDTVQPEAIAVYFYVCVSKYTQLEQGPYFTPHVDENGILSWTNNGGLVNPPNVNITGPAAFTVSIGEVTTLASDQDATVTNVGTAQHQVWNIAIPEGEKGAGLEIGDIGFTQMAIDETKGKRRYLNGQVIIQEQYVQFTNILKSAIALYPNIACSEEDWQATVTLSPFGLCDKFVVDDNAGTIRLPKYPNYFIGGIESSVAVAGNGMTLGMTDGTNNFGVYGAEVSHYKTLSYRTDYYGTNTGESAQTQTGAIYKTLGLTTDATKSGIEGSLTQQQIKGAYFIQVATGAETEVDIVNEIELNNPYSLGDSKYSPLELNNISWLKSEGQWNSKATYPSFYDWALLNLNNGVEGFASSTDTYTDYDYVLNTSEETFRLPLLDGSEDIVSNRYDDLPLGVSNTEYTAPANGWFYINKVSGNAGNYMNLFVNIDKTSTADYHQRCEYCASNQAPSNETTLALSVPVKRKDTVLVNYSASGTLYAFRFIYATGNGSLYFYVGETVQNANLINAGRIEEKLVDKVDTNANNLTAEGKSLIASYGMPSNRYIDLTLGASGTTYTAPANGYIVFEKLTTAANQLLALGTLKDASGGIGQSNRITYIATFNPVSGQAESLMLPVKRGDYFYAAYSAAGDTIYFRFVYAEGDK